MIHLHADECETFMYVVSICAYDPNILTYACIYEYICAPSYRHLLRLVLQVAGGLDGAGSGSQPVGQHGGQSADAHQRGGRQSAEELSQLGYLRYPQAAHYLLGLHLLHQGGTQLCGTQEIL